MAGCIIFAFIIMILNKKYPYELTKAGGYDEETQVSKVCSEEKA
jgi:hypothetical protein